MNSQRLKRFGLRFGLVIGILACLSVIFVNLASLRCFNLVFDAVCHVPTKQNVVALTFEDSLNPQAVDEALPVLAAHDAKATFFLTGQKVENQPETTRKLLAAGHELGNRGYSDQIMEDRSQEFHESEIMKTDALLREVGVKRPHLFRPPYGIRSVGLLWELHKAGYLMVMWDVSDAGKREAPPEAYASAILAQVRPGSIVMLHALGGDDTNARAALPIILAGLNEKGLKSVTVSELLAMKSK